MKGKHILIATLISVVLLTLSFVQLSSQQDSICDPLLDYNDIGMTEVSGLSSQGQGSSGGPTKNVNVTNWPVSTAITVWYAYPMVGWKVSSIYNASGFSHLHVLTIAGLKGSEEVYVEIRGVLWNSDHTEGYLIPAYSVTLTSTSMTDCITIPVPSEEFQFSVETPPGTNAYFSLSFYLTWA